MTQRETIREILPQIRKYTAAAIGGAEVIRSLRDTLSVLGLKDKKRNIPYRHQKILREREEKEKEQEKKRLVEQGLVTKESSRKRRGKNKSKRKNKH